MQMKSAMRNHFTSMRIVAIKKADSNKDGEDMKKLEPAYIAGEIVKCCNHTRN